MTTTFSRHCERQRNFGRMKSGKRVRNERQCNEVSDSNELQSETPQRREDD